MARPVLPKTRRQASGLRIPDFGLLLDPLHHRSRRVPGALGASRVPRILGVLGSDGAGTPSRRITRWVQIASATPTPATHPPPLPSDFF